MFHLVESTTLNDEAQRAMVLRDKKFKLARLLRNTEEMLQYARQGDWENVGKLDLGRRDDVKSLLIDETEEEMPLISESLNTIMNLNDQIAELVKQAKNKSLENLRQLEKAKDAVLNYADN